MPYSLAAALISCEAAPQPLLRRLSQIFATHFFLSLLEKDPTLLHVLYC